MLKTKYLNLLVLSPIKINSDESTREKLVELDTEENRKTGMSSIRNIGTELFSGINRDMFLH